MLRETNNSWRVDENYIKVKGKQKYLYRAVDSEGNALASPPIIDKLKESKELPKNLDLKFIKNRFVIKNLSSSNHIHWGV